MFVKTISVALATATRHAVLLCLLFVAPQPTYRPHNTTQLSLRAVQTMWATHHDFDSLLRYCEVAVTSFATATDSFGAEDQCVGAKVSSRHVTTGET